MKSSIFLLSMVITIPCAFSAQKASAQDARYVFAGTMWAKEQMHIPKRRDAALKQPVILASPDLLGTYSLISGNDSPVVHGIPTTNIFKPEFGDPGQPLQNKPLQMESSLPRSTNLIPQQLSASTQTKHVRTPHTHCVGSRAVHAKLRTAHGNDRSEVIRPAVYSDNIGYVPGERLPVKVESELSATSRVSGKIVRNQE